MDRFRSTTGLATLAILGWGLVGVLPAAAQEDIFTHQQAAFDLWEAGQFDRAIERTEALFTSFPEHQRGKAAFFHIANRLENTRVVEAEDWAEVTRILTQASRYYQRSTNDVRFQKAPAQRRSSDGFIRVAKKLALLAEIGRGEVTASDGAAHLAQMDAPRAAVTLVAPKLAEVNAQTHFYYFLSLIHQTAYVDSLYQRLDGVKIRFGKSQKDLYRLGYERYAPLLATAVDALIANGEAALEKFPGSPHLLDYHVYLGAGYRYAGSLELARIESPDARGDAAAARPHMTLAMKHFRRLSDENAKVVRWTGAALDTGSTSMSDAQKAAYDRAALQRYQTMAQGRVGEANELIASLLRAWSQNASRPRTR